MKAMVLAAGLGERMRPLTEGRAKPALPLLNRPMILHTLEHLRSHGVSEVVINLHHLPESIRAVVGDGSRLGLKIHYSEEPTILGTAGGLKKAEPLMRGPGSFFMVNSDAVSDCDLRAALKKHRESGALATLVLVPRRPGTDYGVVELGDGDRILRIAGAPPGQPDPRASRYTFTGIHVLEPEIFDTIPDRVRSEINREIYPALITSGRMIRGYVHPGLWRELGSPALYIEGTMAFLRSRHDASLASIRSSDGVYLDHVHVPADAVIDPPVLVGRGATIGSKCSLVGGVVVGKHARLGKGCALRTTVVWDGARIGDGASLSECIVTSGVYVPPGASLINKIILRVEGYQGSKEGLDRLGGCWMAGF